MDKKIDDMISEAADENNDNLWELLFYMVGKAFSDWKLEDKDTMKQKLKQENPYDDPNAIDYVVDKIYGYAGKEEDEEMKNGQLPMG